VAVRRFARCYLRERLAGWLGGPPALAEALRPVKVAESVTHRSRLRARGRDRLGVATTTCSLGCLGASKLVSNE